MNKFPNHLDELEAAVFNALTDAFGDDQTDLDFKNKYHVEKVYEQIDVERIKQQAKAKINAVRGVYIIGSITQSTERASAYAKKMRVEYMIPVAMGGMHFKTRMISANKRIVYEMMTDMMSVLVLNNAVKLSGNTEVSYRFNTLQEGFTDEEIDFMQVRIFVTAIQKQNNE